MIADNDWRQRERLDALSRLEDLILRETDPEAWDKTVPPRAAGLAKRWSDVAEEDTPDRTAVLAEMYRLSSEAKVCRGAREYFFWLLTGYLHLEAHVGPEAVVHRKEYLGPFWDRLEAIRKRHDWPEEDTNGDPWNPHEHLDQVPEDYAAWEAEFDRVVGDMERAALLAVCRQYGVPEIAAMKENDPEEYERRYRAGKAYADREGAAGEEGD